MWWVGEEKSDFHLGQEEVVVVVVGDKGDWEVENKFLLVVESALALS